MSLEWLAALISPHEIAPHPNFSNDDNLSRPPAVLAAIVLGQNPWGRAQLRALASDEPHHEMPEYLHAALQSLDFREQHLGIESLSSHLESESQTAETVPECCALAIFVSACLAELEDYDQCEQILTSQLQHLEALNDSHESRVWRSALLAQRGLRRLDAGLSPISDAKLAYEILETVDSRQCADFPTNSGTGEPPHIIVSRMVAALQRSAWSLSPGQFWTENAGTANSSLSNNPFDSIFARIRSPRSELLLTISRDAANEYERLVEDKFGDIVPSSATTIGRTRPDIFYSLLRYELLGHQASRETRKELALFRVVQAERPFSVEFAEDILRLLRRSGDDKTLSRFVRALRSSGPLAAVTRDARQIVRTRRRLGNVDVAELSVLKHSADLMTADDARAAFDLVANEVEHGESRMVGRWRHETTWAEAAWTTLATLANTVGEADRIAATLADVATQYSSDELWDRLIGRALNILDVTRPATGAVAESWKSALGRNADIGRATMRAYLQLTRSEDLLSERLEGTPSDLSDVVELFNATIALGRDFPNSKLRVSKRLASEKLYQIRSNARQGQFSGWAYDPGEIATLLLIEDPDEEYCGEVLDFIFDANVPRNDRSVALGRLARETPSIPANVLATYAERVTQLVNQRSPVSMFGDPDSEVFISALEFAIAYQLLSPDEVAHYLTLLSASPSLTTRRDGCVALAEAVRIEFRPELLWILVRLSYDEDAEVRASSARGIIQSLSRDGSPSGRILERIEALSREDGMAMPFAIVRELRLVRGKFAASKDFQTVVYGILDRYRSGHMSEQVRRAARELITQWA